MERREACKCGLEVSRKEILPGIFGILAGHGLRATVAAAVTTAFGFGVCCALGLRTSFGLSPFFTRRGERRKSVMLASENCDMDLAA